MNATTSRCTAHTRAGARCKRSPVPGAEVCSLHGGRAPQVARMAAVRAELSRWSLAEQPDVDPGETLLKLLAQSSRRAQVYAARLGELDADFGLEATLIGDQLVMEPQTGKLHKVSEYVRGLARLEADERDRCAKFAKLALDAGIAERQIKMVERLGATIEQVLTAAFRELDLTAEQRQAAPAAISRALTLVAGGPD